MNGHTPGPWKADGFGFHVWAERPAGATVQPKICKIIYGGMADAHLIAAAPRLLEACKAALVRIYLFEGYEGDTYKQIAAAIAAAEGRE